METLHCNLQVGQSGLVINSLYPYLGASPDGVVSCDCCDSGLLEIKCPYKYRNVSPTSADALSDRDFCLKETKPGTVSLSQSHQYYDQVQAQLSICKVQYCDFICWTTQGIFIERIFQDENYLSERIPALKNFFCNYILPEILTQKLLEIEPEKRDVSLAEPKPSDVSPDGGLEPNTSNVNSECKKIYCLCRKVNLVEWWDVTIQNVNLSGSIMPVLE